MSKKIIALMTGQLRYFNELNYKVLKNSLKEYDLYFYIVCWKNENEDIKKKFIKLYNPIKLIEIEDKCFLNEVKRIKIPDTAVKSENIFKMWHSFIRGCELLKKEKFDISPDYILRYRSDLLPSNNQKIDLGLCRENDILIPDMNHWNGVNDQFFIFKFSKIKKIITFSNFISEYLNKKLLFSSELIFQRFLNKLSLNINYINFNYKIMKKNDNLKNKLIKKDTQNNIPFREKFFVSINKLKFKLRNFKEFYITKNKRNKYQDILIK
tara:strand:+ start:238 stop:1038 length:801 start_codon:yes stop_codon:yes gene_type:complete